MERQVPRYNLVVGPYEFVQDISNLNRYHIPGGDVVDESWIKQWAYVRKLEVQRVNTPMDGRADNGGQRMGSWESDTRKRFDKRFKVKGESAE
jgi:hypothetical protein